MFKAIRPVIPVTNMKRSVEFWQSLGFETCFRDGNEIAASNYAGVQRDDLVFHLQTFSADDMFHPQCMSLRIELEERNKLESLFNEWNPSGIITAPLGERPWGNFEFGFYDPDRTAFFFYVPMG